MMHILYHFFDQYSTTAKFTAISDVQKKICVTRISVSTSSVQLGAFPISAIGFVIKMTQPYAALITNASVTLDITLLPIYPARV